MAIELLKKKVFSGTSKIFDGTLERILNEIITAVNSGGGEGSGPVAWGDVTDKPAVIAAGADQAAARGAIGAGTSNLELGSTNTTAAAGDHTHPDLATSADLAALSARVTALESTAEG